MFGAMFKNAVILTAYEYDILHLVETHSSPKIEAVVRKSYPHLEFYFHHGPQFKERSDGR